MEGTPARVFTPNRTARAKMEDCLAYSLKYTAVAVPIGTPSNDMMKTSITVP